MGRYEKRFWCPGRNRRKIVWFGPEEAVSVQSKPNAALAQALRP